MTCFKLCTPVIKYCRGVNKELKYIQLDRKKNEKYKYRENSRMCSKVL